MSKYATCSRLKCYGSTSAPPYSRPPRERVGESPNRREGVTSCKLTSPRPERSITEARTPTRLWQSPKTANKVHEFKDKTPQPLRVRKISRNSTVMSIPPWSWRATRPSASRCDARRIPSPGDSHVTIGEASRNKVFPAADLLSFIRSF